jgi:hypothetical protein
LLVELNQRSALFVLVTTSCSLHCFPSPNNTSQVIKEIICETNMKKGISLNYKPPALDETVDTFFHSIACESHCTLACFPFYKKIFSRKRNDCLRLDFHFFNSSQIAMFWRRGPTTEQKAEEAKQKRESNDDLFNHFMLCRALSLQSLECYQEHGTDARQCQRGMEEENLCWGC